MNRLILLIFLLDIILLLPANTPYLSHPDWSSTDSNNYSTGAIWADINQDAYPDLIIANGNDMQRQHLVVYLNSPQGLSNTISWSSEDIDYHGHLDAGDINNDGYPDIVVSVYIGAQGFSSQGKIKLYLNNQGCLESNPSWISADTFYSFSCKLTDINLDGKLDLAVACGEAYYDHPDSNRVYMNIGGTFESLPSWKSERLDSSYDVNTADFDNNGYPDLVFVNENQSNQIYFNYNGELASESGWNSLDINNSANSLSIGDINHDGFMDLAVSDNSQMAESGHFKIYQNNNGILTQNPIWISQFNNFGSGIEFFNNNHDNYDNLIGGGWWTPLFIYSNEAGQLDNESEWASNTASVVERIAFSDCNRDGEIPVSAYFTPNNNERMIKLP